MGTQEAKGQGPGNEEASLCFRGKRLHRFGSGTELGITALEASSRGSEGGRHPGLPQGGPASLWGRGVVSTYPLAEQLRNRILDTKIKK